MQLLVNRTTRTPKSTIGQFSVNGAFFSYCLEPTDRGLIAGMSPGDIAQIKIPDKTCIPTGTYGVTAYDSPKRGYRVPLLLNVPGFVAIEIHIGNFPANTDGCLLLGDTINTDYVGNSLDTINRFYGIIFSVLDNGEAVSITYQ